MFAHSSRGGGFRGKLSPGVCPRAAPRRRGIRGKGEGACLRVGQPGQVLALKGSPGRRGGDTTDLPLSSSDTHFSAPIRVWDVEGRARLGCPGWVTREGGAGPWKLLSLAGGSPGARWGVVVLCSPLRHNQEHGLRQAAGQVRPRAASLRPPFPGKHPKRVPLACGKHAEPAALSPRCHLRPDPARGWRGAQLGGCCSRGCPPCPGMGHTSPTGLGNEGGSTLARAGRAGACPLCCAAWLRRESAQSVCSRSSKGAAKPRGAGDAGAFSSFSPWDFGNVCLRSPSTGPALGTWLCHQEEPSLR